MAKNPTWFTRLRKKFPGEGKNPTIIAPYKTYGTANEVYLRGRVLEDNRIQPYNGNSAIRMLQNTIKRFNTFEKPNVAVEATLFEDHFQAVTDEEGFFKIQQPMSTIKIKPEKTNWIPVQFELVEQRSIQASSKMMIPSSEAEYGVISDIDDTILETGVSSFLKWRLVYNSALKQVQKRQALIGTPDFYRAMQKGLNGQKNNPFFYISNSPWNLYAYLSQFLKQNNFPNGPLLLRDFAFPGTKDYRNEKNHKQREIINIFETYPWLNFILIGDSTEHDASIYSDVAKMYPERVLSIILHTINQKKQMDYVEGIVNSSKHVEMLLVNNTKDAAIAAKQRGYITTDNYENIVKHLT